MTISWSVFPLATGVRRDASREPLQRVWRGVLMPSSKGRRSSVPSHHLLRAFWFHEPPEVFHNRISYLRRFHSLTRSVTYRVFWSAQITNYPSQCLRRLLLRNWPWFVLNHSSKYSPYPTRKFTRFLSLLFSKRVLSGACAFSELHGDTRSTHSFGCRIWPADCLQYGTDRSELTKRASPRSLP